MYLMGEKVLYLFIYGDLVYMLFIEVKLFHLPI